MNKEQVVNIFAEELAKKQRKADEWYYLQNNQEMSSHLLDEVLVIKELAIKLEICKEVYDKAYQIYDFRNSGKKGYTLKNGKIVKIS